MKVLTKNKSVLLLFIILFLCSKSIGQESKITVTQDPKFEQLLNEKRKLNTAKKSNQVQL